MGVDAGYAIIILIIHRRCEYLTQLADDGVVDCIDIGENRQSNDSNFRKVPPLLTVSVHRLKCEFGSEQSLAASRTK